MPHFIRNGLLQIVLLCALGSTAQALAGDETKNAAGFTDTQMAYVKGWIMERAPECPPEIAEAVALQFLDDLQTNHPSSFDQLPSESFPSNQFESILLRDIAAHLAGPSWAALKERLAVARVGALMAAGRGPGALPSNDAAAIVTHLKAAADLYYQRLLDGRIEDDDLSFLIKKGQPGGESSETSEASQKRTLTAEDIVAEFSRHNQEGSALQKLRAYVIEGDVESEANGNLHLLLLKLRPDFARVVVMKDGLTRSVTAGHGGTYWHQVPGGAPEQVNKTAASEMVAVGEFADPLFADEGYSYTRLPDGSSGSGAYYRIGIKRAGASGYIARIDLANFHQIGREEENGSVSVMSDFRKVAGITLPFREESTDSKGARTAFQISRFTPNPGLTQVIFDPPPPRDQGYFQIERLIARSAAAKASEEK